MGDYLEAMAELEQIASELDGNNLDVDLLSSRVARAFELVNLLRERIEVARMEVTRVVASLEAPDDPDRV
ncbi:MAG: exodeoxyribonuclease VII small subunit [Acidimicrobiia bacterium]